MSVSQSAHDGFEKFSDGAARVGRGALAGLIGGAIASYVMNRYQEVESRPVTTRRSETETPDHDEIIQANPGLPKSDPAGDPKVQVAQQISRKLFDHELSDNEQKAASPVVHYVYGAAVGALYGGLAELMPTVGAGLGIPYATLLFLGGDEVALPAMGIAKNAAEVPAERHASALATHFVYGVTLDITRRILRRVL